MKCGIQALSSKFHAPNRIKKFLLSSVFHALVFYLSQLRRYFLSSLQDVKVGILCGGGLSDTNISADFVRLVSKLCRLTVPLPDQSASKPSQQRGHHRSNSTPALISWDSMQINPSMPCPDYKIIGRQHSLKLLCERCSNGPTPAYNLPKPRKIRAPEPYQHLYKPISKALDQKLRYGPVPVIFHKLKDIPFY